MNVYKDAYQKKFQRQDSLENNQFERFNSTLDWLKKSLKEEKIKENVKVIENIEKTQRSLSWFDVNLDKRDTIGSISFLIALDSNVRIVSDFQNNSYEQILTKFIFFKASAKQSVEFMLKENFLDNFTEFFRNVVLLSNEPMGKEFEFMRSGKLSYFRDIVDFVSPEFEMKQLADFRKLVELIERKRNGSLTSKTSSSIIIPFLNQPFEKSLASYFIIPFVLLMCILIVLNLSSINTSYNDLQNNSQTEIVDHALLLGSLHPLDEIVYQSKPDKDNVEKQFHFLLFFISLIFRLFMYIVLAMLLSSMIYNSISSNSITSNQLAMLISEIIIICAVLIILSKRYASNIRLLNNNIILMKNEKHVVSEQSE